MIQQEIPFFVIMALTACFLWIVSIPFLISETGKNSLFAYQSFDPEEAMRRIKSKPGKTPYQKAQTMFALVIVFILNQIWSILTMTCFFLVYPASVLIQKTGGQLVFYEIEGGE